MAQHLFEDRFHFKYHLETVMGRVYEMVLSRGGLKMQPADDSPGLERDHKWTRRTVSARHTCAQGYNDG
jgi:uncharacterized protein (TIGR03435 family)